MVGDIVAAFVARLPGLFNDRMKMTEVEIFQDTRKIAGRPRFITFRADVLDALEGVGGGGNRCVVA